MHWILLVGGEAFWAGGQLIHRACFQHCSSGDVERKIHQSMKNIYIVTAEHSPPLPGLDTWALGFQIQNQMLIKDKVLPLMKRKMDRLEISEYDDFYEDEPEGLNNANLLSREKCMAWMQSIADYLMDSEETDELDITLYEFSDRPEGFPTLSLPEVSGPLNQLWGKEWTIYFSRSV